MDLVLLVTGIAIGLSVTAPLGPVNVIVIRNAIRRGFTVAFLAGLGAVVADAAYATVAAFGIGTIEQFIVSYSKPLMILGGLLLVGMGIRLARTHIRLDDLGLQNPQRKRDVAGKMLMTFTLTLTNPGVFFGFLAIFATMTAVLRLGDSIDRPITVVTGVAIGGTLWWLFLAFIVDRFKARISERIFDLINRWTGILIAAFGFALLMEAVF
jgi:threonine/homoserine/homoserine lactone efflux protein